MALFQNRPLKFLQKKSQNSFGTDPSIQSQQPVVLKTSSSSLQSQPKTVAPEKAQWSLLGKMTRAAILIGIPIGVVWVANLPYPVIRRPVAQNAPILLLPTYVSMDNHYRLAIASVEQADQLVNNATSPADLDLGEVKVKEAQKHLDALPIWFLNDWPEYNYWWYERRFSLYEFQSARTKVGQLTAKVFQQKNAQTLFTQGEEALNTAKQQYQQASTPTDKKAAIASWKAAIDQLEQIPSLTLAGKTAQKKLDAYKRDFKEVVGLAAGNERISTLIEAARQFSWQAAKTGQNPPHNVTEWKQIEDLWQQAINRVQDVPSQDLAGYAEAQKLLATYQTNLGEVKIRRQAEQDSVNALQQAQRQVENLLALTPTNAASLDRNRTISQLQGIINQLEKVQPGTTAYLKAQELLLSAQNKLKQLQPKG